MLPFLLETFCIALGAGVFAAVYYRILRDKAPYFIQKFMADHENAWWYDAVWHCLPCIAGECGLWACMFLELLPGIFIEPTGLNSYPALCYISNPAAFILGLAVAITGSIFTAMIATRVMSYLIKTSKQYE